MDKRFIGDSGYEVKRSEWAGGKEFLLAENPKAEQCGRFMICEYQSNGIIGEYSNITHSDNVIDGISEWNRRVYKALDEVRAELDSRRLPSEIITADQCIPHDYGQEIKGKVVAIKAECLAPEYRRGSEQLMYVTGGFGASANSRGTALFCVQLSDGKKARYERYQVQGVVKELPDWAKQRLAEIQADTAKTKKERDDAR